MNIDSTKLSVAVYARVSTYDPNPAMQLGKLHEFINRRGWTVYDEYVDQGVSGAKTSRPQLDRLMADAQRQEFAAVVVWKLDRIARSTMHLLSALEEFRVAGIEFISISESIDTSTANGRMVFTIVAAVAELERGLIREHVIAGVRRARADGKKLGRPRAIVDIDQARILHKQGLTFREIARRLQTSRATISRLLKSAVSKSLPTETVSESPDDLEPFIPAQK